MKKASFSISISHLNQGSYVRHTAIRRESTCLSGFLRERGELRHTSFTAEEEERMTNPRPRPKTQTERILTLCAEGLGLREAIAEALS